MKRLFSTILMSLVLALAWLVLPTTARAVTPISSLDVMFETGAPPTPLFSEADFKPGDSITRWAEVTNKTGSPQSISAALENYLDAFGMGDQFDVDIRARGSLTAIFSGTMTQLFATSTIVLDAALPSETPTKYDFKVTFRPTAGNPYQTKTLSFDFVIKLSGDQGDRGGCVGDCGGTTTLTSTGGGGGSAGSTGRISGKKFLDENDSGTQDPGEQGLAGWIIYLDLNNNNLLDAGEPQSVTDITGAYAINGIAAGTYAVREVPQSLWTQVYPGAAAGEEHAVTVGASEVAGINFGNRQGLVAGASTEGGPVAGSPAAGLSGDETGEVKGASTVLPRTGMPVSAVILMLAISLLAAVSGERRRQYVKI